MSYIRGVSYIRKEGVTSERRELHHVERSYIRGGVTSNTSELERRELHQRGVSYITWKGVTSEVGVTSNTRELERRELHQRGGSHIRDEELHDGKNSYIRGGSYITEGVTSYGRVLHQSGLSYIREQLVTSERSEIHHVERGCIRYEGVRKE